MTAFLSAACACGAVASAPCPTLEEGDWASAHATIEAAGFRWHEGLGYRCGDWPSCSPADAPEAARPVPQPQDDLFGEVAA
jgi:hypothetical protein